MGQLAEAWGCSGFAAALAASYVYRLLESVAFQQCVEELGWPALKEVVAAYPEWMPDAHVPHLKKWGWQEVRDHVTSCISTLQVQCYHGRIQVNCCCMKSSYGDNATYAGFAEVHCPWQPLALLMLLLHEDCPSSVHAHAPGLQVAWHAPAVQ